jgi:hypothetical protein
LKEAAKDVAEQRAAREPATVERTYVDYATGEPMPENQTISLERAADDLTRQRGFEAVAAEREAKEQLALKVDLERLGISEQQVADAKEILQQQQAEQQQPEQIQPQPVSDLPPEVAEIAQELERSPKLKAALQEEAVRIQQAHSQAEQARQQYSQATQQAHQFAIQSMMAAFPEFNGLSNVQQIAAALQVLQQNNPQRHAAAVQHLHRVDALGKQASAVQQQQQQQVQAQVHQWVAREDRAVDEYLAKNESPETVEAVKRNLPKVLSHYGVSVDEFRQALAQTPMLRSAPMQKMLFQIGKQFVLQEQVAAKVAKPVPQVQRPGSSQSISRSDYDVAAAREAFLKNPDDLRAAAKYVQAKRNARS